MFNARRAVSTKYIIPIIFCLGVSFPPAMVYSVILVTRQVIYPLR
jgi:hypothetical protein